MKDAPATKTRHACGARADKTAENIEIMAHLIEHEGTAPFLLAPPVAREITAMLRRQMLRGIERDKFAQRAGIHPRNHLAHDRHGAHDEAEIERRRFGAGEDACQREGFFFRSHDRLLAEDRIAGRERRQKMIEMEMIGRTDEYK